LPKQHASQPPDHDFSICKLCKETSGVATYSLGKAQLYCCRSCDFHYLDQLDPPPDDPPDVLTVQQQRYIDERLSSNSQVLAARLRLIQEFIDLRDMRCLDVGTGVGQFLRLLADAGAKGEGIEPSGLRRAFAHNRFGLHLQSELIEAPFWQQQSRSFDLVTLWDVLEHVNDPVATLQSAFVLLKPGGRLFIETDNRDSVPYRLSCLVYRLTLGGIPLFLPHFYRPAPYGHKQIFRPGQLYDLARRCGFELIAASPGYTGISDGQIPHYRPRGQIVLVARKPF
jgi:2-polyprenyl-6-hydroxyphenyl methylase/3-demethylubiquinone-9 3-methyltransferase